MLEFRMLCRITQSSDAHRTESVSVMDHKQTMAVSSRVLDQKQQNIFGRISFWSVELQGHPEQLNGCDHDGLIQDRIGWVEFNVPLNTLQVISGTGFCETNDIDNCVKADKAWILPVPLHHVTIIQPLATAFMHGVRVPVRQTQSAGPVRTAHMSVLLTVNIVSHNPARSSSDNILS